MSLAVLTQIKKYPIKGLAGQELDSVELVTDRGIVGDRQFALTYDEKIDGSEWKQSRNYVINAVHDGLLTIKPDWADLDSFKTELPGLVTNVLPPAKQPRLVECSYPDIRTGLWDYTDSQLSIMNLQTLRLVSKAFGQALEMDRFRGNLIIDDLPPWAEFGLAGWRFKIGEAELEFSRPVRRCPATAVNPVSGLRDVPVNALLVERFGHGYFGMYARVTKSGMTARGDRLVRLQEASIQPSDAMVEGAGPYTLWPKLAVLKSVSTHSENIELELESSGPWPLVDQKIGGHLKLHCGPDRIVQAEITRSSGISLNAVVHKKEFAIWGEHSTAQTAVVTGPYRAKT